MGFTMIGPCRFELMDFKVKLAVLKNKNQDLLSFVLSERTKQGLPAPHCLL